MYNRSIELPGPGTDSFFLWGAANLLGGRALRYELFGMTAFRLQDAFDLDHVLSAGYMPRILAGARPTRMLDAFAADYVKEEIAAHFFERHARFPTANSPLGIGVCPGSFARNSIPRL